MPSERQRPSKDDGHSKHVGEKREHSRDDPQRPTARQVARWRKQAAVLQWYVEPAADQISTATRWLSSAHQAVQPFSAGGYVNYLEANTSASRYFGSNLSQLTTVRQKYDPNRIMFSGLYF